MAKRKAPIDFAAKMAEESEPPAAAVVSPSQSEAQASDRYIPPARRGRKMLGGYYSDEVHEQLERLILDRRREPDAPKNKQAALDLALDLLFAHYGLPQIARHGKSPARAPVT